MKRKKKEEQKKFSYQKFVTKMCYWTDARLTFYIIWLFVWTSRFGNWLGIRRQRSTWNLVCMTSLDGVVFCPRSEDSECWRSVSGPFLGSWPYLKVARATITVFAGKGCLPWREDKTVTYLLLNLLFRLTPVLPGVRTRELCSDFLSSVFSVCLGCVFPVVDYLWYL